MYVISQVTVNWYFTDWIACGPKPILNWFPSTKQFVGLIVLSHHHAVYLFRISSAINKCSASFTFFLNVQNVISSLQFPFSLIHPNLHENTKVDTPASVCRSFFTYSFSLSVIAGSDSSLRLHSQDTHRDDYCCKSGMIMSSLCKVWINF